MYVKGSVKFYQSHKNHLMMCPQIADFGLSNLYHKDKLLQTFCGSPLYASPEIVNGRPYRGPEVRLSEASNDSDCYDVCAVIVTHLIIGFGLKLSQTEPCRSIYNPFCIALESFHCIRFHCIITVIVLKICVHFMRLYSVSLGNQIKPAAIPIVSFLL